MNYFNFFIYEPKQKIRVELEYFDNDEVFSVKKYLYVYFSVVLSILKIEIPHDDAFEMF